MRETIEKRSFLYDLRVTKLGLALVLFVAACGDNSEQCGPGTVSQDGTCVWDGTGSTLCGDGTTLDPVSNTCVVDPSLCGDGTVFVDGRCQDPNAGITIDLQEGPEPNGFETSALPAGLIAPKAIGAGGFVVHGCIQPANGVADLDAYTMTVTGPTLLAITAAGIDGLDGGFLVHDRDPNNLGWERFGLNLANDTSHRQVFLPKAGSYDFVVTDARSLLPLVTGSSSTTLPAAGNPDGTSCYYVTITQEAVPAPTPITVATGLSTPLPGDKVMFVSAPLPTGLIDVTADDDAAENATAFDVLVNEQYLLSDQNGSAHFGGIRSTDTTVFALDYVYNYNNGVVPNYALAFDLASDAQALPTTGTTLSSTSVGQDPSAKHLNLYSFDAAAADTTFGMNLTFSHPVQGAIIDARSRGTVASFGGLATSSPGSRFTHYTGLVRLPNAGRYYLAVFDSADPVGTAFTVTSTLTAIMPTAVASGTPVTGQANNPFDAVPYTFSSTTNPWNTISLTGTNTGDVNTSFFSAATAYGRLQALSFTAGGTAPPDATVLAEQDFHAPGDIGGIVFGPGLPNILFTASPQAPTGTATFDFDLEPRTYTALTGGLVQILLAETSPANASHRYYVPAAPGKTVTITVHPTTTTQSPQLFTLDAAENVVQQSNATPTADAVITVTQDASAATPFDVRGALGAAETYNLKIEVQ